MQRGKHKYDIIKPFKLTAKFSKEYIEIMANEKIILDLTEICRKITHLNESMKNSINRQVQFYRLALMSSSRQKKL